MSIARMRGGLFSVLFSKTIYISKHCLRILFFSLALWRLELTIFILAIF